jgi:hypothetical protein
MNRFLVLLFALLALSLASCGDNSEQAPSGKPGNTSNSSGT